MATRPSPQDRPAGGKPDRERPDHPRDEALVDETVDESFPASDPPAWTSETGSGSPEGARPKKDHPNP